MNLTEAEKVIFSQLQRKDEVTLDDLVKIINCSRHSLIVRIKYLSAKTAPHGWIITQHGGVGRNNRATYTLEKKF